MKLRTARFKSCDFWVRPIRLHAVSVGLRASRLLIVSAMLHPPRFLVRGVWDDAPGLHGVSVRLRTYGINAGSKEHGTTWLFVFRIRLPAFGSVFVAA